MKEIEEDKNEFFIGYLNGSKIWRKNNELHRTNGPARIYPNGDEYWFYEGKSITNEVMQLMEEGRLNPDWRNWTEEDEFLFILLIS